MNKKTLSPSLFVVASFFMAIALTIEQVFVYLRFYDFENHLWHHDAPGVMKGLFYITVGLIALFAVAFALTEKKNEQAVIDTHATNTATRVVSLMCVLALAATLVAQLCAIGSYDHLYLLIVSDSEEYVAIAALLHRITLILMPFACLFFVQLIRGKKASVGLGLFPILYLVALTLRVYFDMNTLLSDPRWAFRVVTLLSALLFMLFDLRLLLQPSKLFLYRVVAIVTMCITATSGLTNIAFNISGHLSDGIEIAYYAFELVFALYIAVRLFTVTQKTDEAQKNEADAEEENLPSEEEEAIQETDADENTLPDDTTATEAPEPEPEEELDDLSEEEVKAFYKAVTASVKKRKNIVSPTAEEENEIREECLAIIASLLQNEDRNERISAVRAFVAGTQEPSEA